MFNRLFILVLMALATCAQPAFADWTQFTDSLMNSKDVVGYRHTWTDPATSSSRVDMSVCLNPQASLQVRWNPSVEDASRDATMNLRECATSTTPVSQCEKLKFEGESESDWLPVKSAQANYLHLPYVIAEALTATAGGDTADVSIRCVTPNVDQTRGMSAGPVGGRKMLLVGDSYVSAHTRDEGWALAFAQYSFVGAGFTARMASLLGSQPSGNQATIGLSGMGQVIACSARSSGTLFGANPDCDILTRVANDKSITDIVFINVGSNDFGGFPCAHGTTFDPASQASGVCTVAQSQANFEYLLGQLKLMGRNVFWQVPLNWIGFFELDGDGQPYRDAIEDLLPALTTFCASAPGAGACYVGDLIYREGCAGSTTLPDPGAVTNDCHNNNTLNYGDGAGATNKLNNALVFTEDTLYADRSFVTYGIGGVHIHPSGYGYSMLTRALMADMKALDPSIVFRWSGFDPDLTRRPAIPTVTIGTVTATSIQVTPTRGQFVNGTNGTEGACVLSDCVYTCWATCVDVDGTSADPACWQDLENGDVPVAREIGAPSGAAHQIEEDGWIRAPRNVVQLRDGELGLLRGLVSGTDYKVACVAQSPTAVSYPGVRNQTTP